MANGASSPDDPVAPRPPSLAPTRRSAGLERGAERDGRRAPSPHRPALAAMEPTAAFGPPTRSGPLPRWSFVEEVKQCDPRDPRLPGATRNRDLLFRGGCGSSNPRPTSRPSAGEQVVAEGCPTLAPSRTPHLTPSSRHRHHEGDGRRPRLLRCPPAEGQPRHGLRTPGGLRVQADRARRRPRRTDPASKVTGPPAELEEST